MSKELLGALSALFVFAVAGPYIWSILKGKTKPHLFTWITWTFGYVIMCAAQYVGGAGPGMWASGTGCVFEFTVVILAIRHGEKNITITDWLAFIGSLAAIPLWYVTKNPMWAVILLAVIDGLGYYPTFRKSWSKPQKELVYMYVMDAIRYAMAITAMDHYSVTTILTPLTIVVNNSAFIAMVMWRRAALKNKTT